MNEKRVLLHIGFSRTGTTFLQNLVFPHLAGIHFINKFKPLKSYTTSAENESAMAVTGKIESCDDASIIFFSDEGLIGRAPLLQISLLKTLFPEATILLTLRSQFDRISSQYNHRLRGGATCRSLRAYLQDDIHVIRQNNAYASIVSALSDAFGERPIVSLFEEYTKDVFVLVKELYKAIEGDPPVEGVAAVDAPSISDTGANFELSRAGIEAAVDRRDDKYRNPSIAVLFPLFRFISTIYNMGTVMMAPHNTGRVHRFVYSPIASAAVYGDNRLRNRFREKERRIRRKQRAVVRDLLGDFIRDENRCLEDLLGRKLPANYFE